MFAGKRLSVREALPVVVSQPAVVRCYIHKCAKYNKKQNPYKSESNKHKNERNLNMSIVSEFLQFQ